MSVYELRIYSLASAEALEAYRTVYYPNHEVSLQKLFGVTVHGYWSAALRFFVLLSYPEGADPDEMRQQYREHPESAANMPGFDPAVIRDVSVTLLTPAAGSPLR
jgi:hypothetical protein